MSKDYSDKSLEDIFDSIHRKQAERLLEILDSGGPLTAQEFNAISKFLSDNGISGVTGENKALTDLQEGLAKYETGDVVSMFQPQ